MRGNGRAACLGLEDVEEVVELRDHVIGHAGAGKALGGGCQVIHKHLPERIAHTLAVILFTLALPRLCTQDETVF